MPTQLSTRLSTTAAESLQLEAPSRDALPLIEQLPPGRLVEIAAARQGAQMTTAVACLRRAQALGETTAWVQPAGGSLFPPDLVEHGIDLRALTVIHVPLPAGVFGLAKAAELLLRSGGFGMVVLDLHAVSSYASWSSSAKDTAWQGRLLGLSREHRSWLLLLSSSSHAQTFGSLGPLVSLCIEPRRRRLSRGCFAIEPAVRKDKSSLLGPLAPSEFRGPFGLV